MKSDVGDLRFEYFTQDWTGSREFILEAVFGIEDALAIALIKVKKIGKDLKAKMTVKQVPVAAQ